MQNQLDLEELIELLNIPEFERIIYHKVEELKCVMGDKIQFYKNLKNNFRKAAYGNLNLYENRHPKKTPTYRFELNRTARGRWIPTVIEPPPPFQTNVEAILPLSAINFMIRFKTDPETIRRHIGSFQCPAGKKSFHLEFSKYSDDHILGAIRENRSELTEGQGRAAEKQKVVKVNFHHKEKEIKLQSDSQSEYLELIHYMQACPQIGEEILNYFNSIQKPMLDIQN
jgi:hypothetical protein